MWWNQFQTSTHLQRLVHPAAPPAAHNPHSEEILSTYDCEAAAAIASCANGASSGRDVAFCSQYARAGVDSAECWTAIRYCVSCSATDVRTGWLIVFWASFEARNLNFFKAGMTCSSVFESWVLVSLFVRSNWYKKEMKIKLVANIFYLNSSRFYSFPVSKF